VALAIAMSVGGHREFVWFAAIYLAVEIPLLVLAAFVHRRRSAQEHARAETA